MNWKNIIDRALWTFAEGFVLALPVSLSADLDGAGWKSLLFSAVLAGISAVKTTLTELIKLHNKKYVY
ncbi:MAG: hypothetical protein II135_11865 [Clostridia bacterium]|nr:hypothetical protein [Clostridia bacterium]MBQ3870720.1 hypothetical protein [Clostridia bacterium]